MAPLDGWTVIELSSEATAFAGKMLADMGADVIVVEPPGGSPLRGLGPFLARRNEVPPEVPGPVHGRATQQHQPGGLDGPDGEGVAWAQDEEPAGRVAVAGDLDRAPRRARGHAPHGPRRAAVGRRRPCRYRHRWSHAPWAPVSGHR